MSNMHALYHWEIKIFIIWGYINLRCLVVSSHLYIYTSVCKVIAVSVYNKIAFSLFLHLCHLRQRLNSYCMVDGGHCIVLCTFLTVSIPRCQHQEHFSFGFLPKWKNFYAFICFRICFLVHQAHLGYFKFHFLLKLYCIGRTSINVCWLSKW